MTSGTTDTSKGVLDALHPDEVPRAARLHRGRRAHRRSLDLPVLGAHGGDGRADRSRDRPDRVQPHHELELGVWKIAPMAVHNLIDIAAGALLAASPWIFGFADETASVWVPHVVVGLAAIFLGLTTKQAGGYSYRKADPRSAATG